MTLFERIRDAIKNRLEHHADAQTPLDSEALANEVIEAHEIHAAENHAEPEQPAKTDEVAN